MFKNDKRVAARKPGAIKKELSSLSLSAKRATRGGANDPGAANNLYHNLRNSTVLNSNDSPVNDLHNVDECSSSHTLAIVFPSLEEFVRERDVLRQNVLPELQQFCCDLDLDLECCTLFETADILHNGEEYALMLELLTRPNITTLCFIGDKYGEGILPLELRADEFNAIRTAALELSNDIKLLDEFYALDKTRDPVEYRLRASNTASRDTEGARKLCTTIQKCAKRAFEDGVIHQVNEERQRQLFKSFIELIADAVLGSTMRTKRRHLMVSRRFQGYQATDGTDRWMDASPVKYEQVSALKNAISQQLTERDTTRGNGNLLPFIFNLHGTDPQSWAKSREAAAYEQELSTRLLERLKVLVLDAHPSASTPPHPLPPFSAAYIAQLEHATHCRFHVDITPPEWQPLDAPLDTKLAELIERTLRGQATYVQIHGPSGIGKTATLSRIYNQLQRESERCHAIIRFAHLTDRPFHDHIASAVEYPTGRPCCSDMEPAETISVFANELFRNVFLSVCKFSGQDPRLFGSCFHLSSVLAEAKSLLERIDRPVVVLIDDVHLVRFGRTLGRMENNLRKLFPRLSILCTSTNATHQMLGFPKSEQFELPAPGVGKSVEILQQQSVAQIGRQLSADQLSALRQQLQSSNGNLVLGGVQTEELLKGHTEPSASIETRFQRIESRCGAENVRIVCELICCSPCGITALELMEAFRLRKFTSGMSFEPDDVLSVFPLLVLKHLGRLLCCCFIDRRRVWMFRHASVVQAVRQRYLQTTGEIKLVNEVMGGVMRDWRGSEENGGTVDAGADQAAAASLMLFPQPLNRADTGIVNMRRVRFHWYYLLYTGDIESLKTQTLCSFNYLEATFRACGLARILGIFEECLQQILDHDLLVIFEQVLLPAIQTLIRDPRQLVSEFLNRLRYTRTQNSVHLNDLVEQAMQWTDNYAATSLLVPLTCWISPPKMKQVLSFTLSQWKSSRTLIQPTHNHQHLLVVGNELAPGCIYMFHLASQLLIRTFSGHDQPCSSLCTSNDGQFFVSTALDGTVKVWNFAQLDCIKTLRPTKAKILCSQMSANDKWVATGASDSSARLINIESGTVTHTFRDHTGPVVGCQLSSDNTLLITGAGDFVVMVWDIGRSAILAKLGGLMAPVTCLTITSNDAFLAVACEDETLRVFGLVSGQELHELSGHEARINAMATSADDCQLFAATRGKVIVFDIHNGQLLKVLPCALSQSVTSVKISDDNSFVLLACGDRVHMWNNAVERDVLATDSTLTCVQISPDEKGAGCGTVDGILAFWDLDVCQCLWTTSQQRSGAVTALCFTTDSFYLLSGSAQGTISLWETSNGQMLRQLPVHADSGPVTEICCFADGVRVLSCDQSHQAHVWNLAWLDESVKRIDYLASIPQMMGPLFVRLHDTLIIGQNAANPKEMNIWSLQADSRLFTRAKVHHNETIVCYGVNKAGTMLATGSTDLSLKVWQLESGGLLIQVLVGHEDVPSCCCVSEDSHVVVSGGGDRNLIVWDVQTGAVRRLVNVGTVLRAVEISQDGSVITSSEEDGWIEARHANTGRLLSSFNTHRAIERLVMGADGDRILVQLSNTAQLPIICLHNSPANMSPAAASRYSNSNQRNSLVIASDGSTGTGETEDASPVGPAGIPGISVAGPSPGPTTSTASMKAAAVRNDSVSLGNPTTQSADAPSSSATTDDAKLAEEKLRNGPPPPQQQSTTTNVNERPSSQSAATRAKGPSHRKSNLCLMM